MDVVEKFCLLKESYGRTHNENNVSSEEIKFCVLGTADGIKPAVIIRIGNTQ